jgi:hypothetical protein
VNGNDAGNWIGLFFGPDLNPLNPPRFLIGHGKEILDGQAAEMNIDRYPSTEYPAHGSYMHQAFPLVHMPDTSEASAEKTINARRPWRLLATATPKLSADREFIRFQVHLKQVTCTWSEVGNWTTLPVLDAVANVPAGKSVAFHLGRIRLGLDDKIESKIPVLGDLPYVGSAFRYRLPAKVEEYELFWLLKPSIMPSAAGVLRDGN